MARTRRSAPAAAAAAVVAGGQKSPASTRRNSPHRLTRAAASAAAPEKKPDTSVRARPNTRHQHKSEQGEGTARRSTPRRTRAATASAADVAGAVADEDLTSSLTNSDLMNAEDNAGKDDSATPRKKSAKPTTRNTRMSGGSKTSGSGSARPTRSSRHHAVAEDDGDDGTKVDMEVDEAEVADPKEGEEEEDATNVAISSNGDKMDVEEDEEGNDDAEDGTSDEKISAVSGTKRSGDASDSDSDDSDDEEEGKDDTGEEEEDDEEEDSSDSSDDESSDEEDEDGNSNSNDATNASSTASAAAAAAAASSNNSSSSTNHPNDGLSDYERMRLERIKRNQDRLRQLGLLDMERPTLNADKPKKTKEQRDRERAERAATLVPARSQPKRSAKTGLSQEVLTGGSFDMRTMRISSDPRYYDKSRKTIDPFSRRYRCGDCLGCKRTQDCGTCCYCCVTTANKSRRRCVMKQCVGRRVAVEEDGVTIVEGGEKELKQHVTRGGTVKTVQELIQEGRVKISASASVSEGEKMTGDDEEQDGAASTGGAASSAGVATSDADDGATDAVMDDEKFEGGDNAKDERPTRRRTRRGFQEGEDRKPAADVSAVEDTTDDTAIEDVGSKSDGTDDAKAMPDACATCNKDGDLFCCDGCGRGYHSNCHAPKIREIPLGEWRCMECAPGSGVGRPAKLDLYAALPDGYRLRAATKDNNGDVVGDESDDGEEKKSEDVADTTSRSSNGMVKVTVLEPSARCTVCGTIGDEAPVLCKACDLYYHLECHDPPLLNRPRGRWRCGKCKADKVYIPSEILATIPEDHTSPDIAGRTVKVTVTGPETKCGACSKKGGEMIWCRACDTSFHLQCHDPPLETKPRGRWRCTKCKLSNTPAPKPKTKIKRDTLLANLKLFTGEHDDGCYICFNGGELVCCDFCSKAFHTKCHIPPLPFVPDETMIWKCCECSAVERKKKSRCGECKACTRPACGKCLHCLDAKKEKRTIKKPCVKKICPYPRFAAPYSATSCPGVVTTLTPAKEPSSKKRSRAPGGVKRDKKQRRLEDGDRETEWEEIVRAEEQKMEEEEKEWENEFGGGPIVVKFKLNAISRAHMDPESVKIRRIINSARNDPRNSKAQDKAIEFLRKHMSSPEALKKMVLFGAIEMICTAMKDFPDKTIVQAEACCTLAEILWIDPTLCTKIAHEGAIMHVVSAMKNLAHNVKVQQMACGVFRALSYDEDCVDIVNSNGVLTAVFNCIKQNPSRLVVQKEALYFLQNFLVQANDTASAITKARIVPIIVKAMSYETADPEFKQSVCGLIANLALDKRAKVSIGNAGAIPSIVAILNTTSDLDVKQAALSALKHLGLDSKDNQSKIAQEGGLEAVFGAVSVFPDDPVLLIAAFGVLKELCVNDENVAKKIVRKGGIEIILSAMTENKDLDLMQSVCCSLIGYLPYSKRDTIEAPRLAHAIIAAMKKHPGVRFVQIEGCDALLELAQVASVRTILKEKKHQKLLEKTKRSFDECESDVDDILAACK